MADGKGCKCAAYSESECGCDADWTPQEVYDLRAENARLKEAIRRLADQDATLSVCNGNVTVTMDATLTDAERDDLQYWRAECLRQCSAATDGGSQDIAERWQERANRVACLLDRTK